MDFIELIDFLSRANAEALNQDKPSAFREHNVQVVTRESKSLEFIDHLDVAPQMFALCENYLKEIEGYAPNAGAKKIMCMLRFFRNFVLIHPFADANGRTAKKWLERELATRLKLKLKHTDGIDRVLLKPGNTAAESELKELLAGTLTAVEIIPDA
jgi:hypothetical protein